MRGPGGGSFAYSIARGKLKRGKGTKWMAIADGHGLAIAIKVHSASPHEVKLAKDTINSIPVKGRLKRVIGDRAYSSRPLFESLLNDFGVDLVSPPKSNFLETPGKTVGSSDVIGSAGKWNGSSLG